MRTENIYRALKEFQTKLYSNDSFNKKVDEYFLFHQFTKIEAAHRKTESSLTSIKGPVWGTIPLNMGSSQIIDLPFVQRLRFVTHTGIVKFFFPGSGFSTLDHAIGTHFILNRIFSSPKNSSEKSHCEKIDQCIVLHAAILSHISAPPFGNIMASTLLDNKEGSSINIFGIDKTLFDDVFTKTIERIAGPHWVRHASRARIISASLVLSEQFRTFYERLASNLGFEREDATFDLAAAILGLPFRRGHTHYGDTLYGSLGASQLDYLFRVASGCGFNITLDLDRVMESISVRRISSRQRINGLDHLVDFADENGRTSIIVLTSKDTAVSRELSDSYVQRFRRLDTQPAITYLSVLFKQMIEEVFLRSNTTYSKINTEYSNILLNFEQSILKDISQENKRRSSYIAKQFLFRELGRRTFKISKDLFEVSRPPFLPRTNDAFPEIENEICQEAFDLFRKSMVARDWRIDIEKKITQEARYIYELLNKHKKKISFLLPTKNEPNEITIVSSTIINEEDRLQVGDIINEITEYKREKWSVLPDHETTIDLFSNHGDEIIFYTDEEWREIIFCAIERVLYREIIISQKIAVKSLYCASLEKYGDIDFDFLFKAKFSRTEMAKICGIDQSVLAEITAVLSAAGDFDKIPCLLPVDQGTMQLLESSEAKFSNFVGESGYRIDRSHLREFLSQFPPDLRFDVIDLIKKLNIITRDDLTNFIIKTSIQISDENKKDVHLVPLSKSSGKLIRGYIGDVEHKSLSIYDDIEAAIEFMTKSDIIDDSIILFFDDNLMSGTQSTNQIGTWMDSQYVASDERVEHNTLSHENRLRLQSISTKFIFYVSDAKGRQLLKESAEKYKLNINGDCILYRTDSKDLCGHEFCSVELRDYLSLVGEQLYREKITSKNKKKDRDFAKQRALGFDNYEGIFCFPHNAPTSLYTPLWCPGKIQLEKNNEFAWIPLFVRNNSLVHYVFR